MNSKPGLLIVATLALCVIGGQAQAYESFSLPQGTEGNMMGLAYRQSDGHFFVTQEAYDPQTPLQQAKGLVYELDHSGHLLQTVDLGGLAPGVTVAGTILSAGSSNDLFVETASYQQSIDKFTFKVYKLSGDLKSMTDSGVPEPLKNSFPRGPYTVTGMTDTDFYAHDHWGSLGSSVYITSRATGDVRVIDLSAYKDTVAGCVEWDGSRSMCATSVAQSWNGGFFLMNEGNVTNEYGSYNARLLEFDADGKLLHAMEFNPAVYDYHPLAMAVDPISHEVFVSFNNRFVATVTERELQLGVLTVPEPGTWSLWLLGALMMILSRFRLKAHLS